ncbi:hypothetical protein BOX15_Mlig014547g3, partial [Macrostomum lignano]
SKAAGKLTTGLTGLAVNSTPHISLTALYDRTLKLLARMPADAKYRQSTEAIVKERLAAVNSEPDISRLEKRINCGQIEEVVQQAERELQLARNFLAWKPWEPLIGQAPPNQWKWPL